MSFAFINKIVDKQIKKEEEERKFWTPGRRNLYNALTDVKYNQWNIIIPSEEAPLDLLVKIIPCLEKEYLKLNKPHPLTVVAGGVSTDIIDCVSRKYEESGYTKCFWGNNLHLKFYSYNDPTSYFRLVLRSPGGNQ